MNRDELRHHGIKGQKWGVRRFQNADGTLTLAGKRRYDHEGDKLTKKGQKRFNQDRWKQDRNDFIETDSITKGQKFFNMFFGGAAGTYAYNSLRTAGYSPPNCEGRMMVASTLGGPIGNIILATKTANKHKRNNYD